MNDRNNLTDDVSSPLYHEITPNLLLGLRITGIVTIAMVALAFIFCLVQGASNSVLYLLACNLIISSFVGIVNTWWYKSGDLPADKYWYMLIVALVIIFQCLATDVFVFNYEEAKERVFSTTTLAPNTTTPHSNDIL